MIKKAEVIAPGLTEEEQREIEETEKEVDVEKKQAICIVHKGPITGVNYICPKCETNFCLKCATSLKEKVYVLRRGKGLYPER